MKTSDTYRLALFILCCVSLWGTACLANATEEQANNLIMLWPKDAAGQGTEGMGTPKPDRGDGHIRLTDITKPSMRYFPARVQEGQESVPAVILCPGGGYMHLVTTKMTPIAEWLNDQGISAFILHYRTPKKRKQAFQDVQRAVRIVRSRASEWNIDPRRIGVMGSSAGGHLSARVSTGFDIQTYDEVDDYDRVSCKPDFTVLLYPAYMNKGEALSKEFTVSSTISPTLIVSAKDDKGFFAGSPIYADALREAGASIRVHFFEKGGHGFSLRPKEYPLSTWPELCLQWFKDQGILEQEAYHVDPDEVIAGFDARVARMFKAESGKPLVRAEKKPPLKPGRGNYVRHYSYSMVAYAARCLYLNESLDQANAALVENARHYLDHPKDVNDRDSFHWHASEVMRLFEMYGPKGTEAPGRLSQETVDICLKPISMYAEQFSNRWEYKESKTWDIYESENHHAMSFSTCWNFARIAMHHPDYKDVEYGGFTPAEHYEAWNKYFVVYCRERARKGMFIEMMSGGYNTTLMKGIYNFYDFGEPEVKRAAGLLLDLYFAYFAQEQIDGIQGGGQSRIYFKRGLPSGPVHGIKELVWYYFGMGEVPAVSGHDLNAALSDYRPPAVVADLALDVQGRGRYEVKQFPRGLGQTGDRNPYRVIADHGGIQRYSYCDPSFILGTPMVEARPLNEWVAISSQNRWQGVIFQGETPSRIVPLPRPKDDRVALNGFWSVQRKGCLITQKLKSNRGAAEMIVWMSQDGLGKPVEEEGIVFVEAPGAYAAVRVGQNGYTLSEKVLGYNTANGYISDHPLGWIITPADEYAPVILEVMAKTGVKSFRAFKNKVKACKPQANGTVLSYQSIYGDTLTLDTSYKQTPTVNGEPIHYSKPEMAFDSPYLKSEYGSGVVTIEKGKRKHVLDFNKEPGDCEL